MAYIAGQAIDGWCAARHCTLRQRLELFLQVVRAVAHGHGRLVVDRDIKSSNVLVDDEGRVHLLDSSTCSAARILTTLSPASYEE